MRDETTGGRTRGRAAGAAPERRERRSPAALALSVALHLALVMALAQVIVVPTGTVFRLFDREEPRAEQLTYADVGAANPAPEAEPAAGPPPPPLGVPDRSPDDGPAAPPATRLVAPATTPSTLPPPGAGTPDGVRGGTGAPGGGGGGATAGLRPTYTDSPIWTRPGDVVERRPLGFGEKLDSAIAGDFDRLRDSAVVEAGRRRPGDWTFERNGQKYGMDQQFIRLGKFSVPTALLGLLNLTDVQANPTAVDRERRLSQMRREIQEQAGRMQAETDIREVIAEIRQRKDRERAARRAVAGRGGG